MIVRGYFNRIKRPAALLLLLLMAAAFIMPFSALAEGTGRKVRVGWFESPFNSTDQFGRRSGYAYEYQRKIAAYTGWEYEYVEGSWAELMDMLKRGEIDLMSDVSYTEERRESMLFASLPMGTEAYYIFVSPDNSDISTDNLSAFNGKRVGVTVGSVQKDLFLEWEGMHGVEAELVEQTCSEEESLRMLYEGELDAFVTLDVYGDSETIIPVCKIGSSDFYFAVRKDYPELLAELDAAMNRIQDENMYFNQQMYEKHLRTSGTNRYLSVEEKEWLAAHGTIRVGYQTNYLAFCSADETTGELIGALRDYLAYASQVMENAELNFEAISYPTAAAALEALKNGEVDCMFPANLTDYDGETMGVVMTPAIIRTEMDAVVRASEQKEFIRKEKVTVAVNRGNTNYELFLTDNYPGWERAYFTDTAEGLEAVAAGKADCVIISNYRFSNISKKCEKLHLASVYTGVDMDYCFALREGDTVLYSIISRVTNVVPSAAVNAALTYYSTEDAKTTALDFIKEYWAIILVIISAVVIVILILLLRNIRVQKKVSEEEHLVDDLNRQVFVDALTSVKNKGAYANYIQQLQDRLDKEEQFDFAIGVFDCDDLKQINDRFGHDKGDEYLKAASRLICRTFQHSPVFRIGGDEFAVILLNDDLKNLDALIETFRSTRAEVCAAAENKWDEVHVSMGIARYEPGHDRSVIDVARRADKVMYENKSLSKLR